MIEFYWVRTGLGLKNLTVRSSLVYGRGERILIF